MTVQFVTVSTCQGVLLEPSASVVSNPSPRAVQFQAVEGAPHRGVQAAHMHREPGCRIVQTQIENRA